MSWLMNVGGTISFGSWGEAGAGNASNETSTMALDAETAASRLTAETIKLYAFDAFKCFNDNWDFDDFWKRAHTCDACVSLLEALKEKHFQDSEFQIISAVVQNMLVMNLAYFQKSDLNTKWSDDFGWWTLLGIRAAKLMYELNAEVLAKDYFTLSLDCWGYLVKQGYDVSPNAKPVAHGCRNSAAETPTEGVKNTVVNALVLLASTRICLFAKENIPSFDRKPFLQKAAEQWIWFSQWFELNNDYLKTFNDNAALASERPFGIPDYKDDSHPDWPIDTKGWFWTGDQGLLIGGLLDLLEMKEDLMEFLPSGFDIKVSDTVKKLVRGIQLAIVGDDGIIYEPPCSSSYSTYSDDYFGGRGILARHLDVKKIKELTRIDFSENLSETVAILWSTRHLDSNQFKPDCTTIQQNQAYFKRFEAHLGFRDDVTTWNFNSTDDKFIKAASQALGIDFLAAAYKALKR